MFLVLAAYLGGVLTILSPCILPVLPFVFARSNQPFTRSGLPILLGMAITFAAVASLAAVGGGWVVEANYYGRLAAILLIALFGITLLLPGLSERMTRPIVALGARLSQTAGGATFGSSLVLGVATGLLWAPCAGPILGLLLTGAALNGASLGTIFLLLAYAAGAATSLAVALLIDGKVFTAMKRSLGAGEWIRRGLGIAVLAGGCRDRFRPRHRIACASLAGEHERGGAGAHRSPPCDDESFSGRGCGTGHESRSEHDDGRATARRTAAGRTLTAEALRGHVVLVDFWTYSCINCLRTLPYIEAWAKKYRDQGLIVIGVHAPEFAFERNIDNVRAAVKRLGIDYPVAIDNNYAIWRGFNNEYWPAHYFIDADGRIRSHHFGEGNYAESDM
jgi:cytochrome c biogenesis protein CcdA/thiol-disulfide isomerase/thioredoxin